MPLIRTSFRLKMQQPVVEYIKQTLKRNINRTCVYFICLNGVNSKQHYYHLILTLESMLDWILLANNTIVAWILNSLLGK